MLHTVFEKKKRKNKIKNKTKYLLEK